MTGESLLEQCGDRIRILALTGIRSEYDLLYPLLRALEEDPRFDLGLVVCGAHLTPLHGHSVRQIEKDGFRIAERIENWGRSDSRAEKAAAAGRLLLGMSAVLDREGPDLLMVLGDREEAIVGALAGTYVGVPVVHVAGGDRTHPEGGNVDEEVRHAASKLAHVHFTMAPEHAERLLRMGEEPWRVFTVGSGGIDRLRTEPVLAREELAASLGPDVLAHYLVLIHHPLSSQIETAGPAMEVLLSACAESGYPTFVGSPNGDPGSSEIGKEIEKWGSHPRIHFYRNLPRAQFASLLRHARCLVGNSSLGLHEAPYLGLPAVNVGERQRGRLAGENVQWVPAEKKEILVAIRRAVEDEGYRSRVRPGRCPYGDGRMAERSVKILAELPPRAVLLAKRLTY